MAAAPAAAAPQQPDRALWLEVLEKIARPVLSHLARRQLKARMPVEGKTADRSEYTHLEAAARTLAGIAPWLEARSAADEPLRRELAELARQAIDAATDPKSPDYCNFERGAQPLVDAAFLAHAVVRASLVSYAGLPKARGAEGGGKG